MEYKYVYYVTADTQKMTILTPWCKNLNDVKKEITQSPEIVVNHSVYPNGLDLLMEQTAERIVIRSNRPLIDNGDGTFTAPEA